MARYQDVVERYRQLDPGHIADVFDAIAAALRLTDEELHQRTGISRPTINQMRGGRVRIAPEKLWPIASALNVEVDVLLMGSIAEAVCEAVRGRDYDRAARRFGPGKADRQHNGGQGPWQLYRDILAGSGRAA